MKFLAGLLLGAALALSFSAVAKPKREVRKPHYEWGVVLESECEFLVNECLRMWNIPDRKIWPDPPPSDDETCK